MDSSTVLDSSSFSNPRIINETLLDCQMRMLALDYAKTLVKDHVADTETTLRNVHDALRLEDLCNVQNIFVVGKKSPPTASTTTPISTSEQRRLNNLRKNANEDHSGSNATADLCSKNDDHDHRSSYCVYVEVPSAQHPSSSSSSRHGVQKKDGSLERPWDNVQDAIEHAREQKTNQNYANTRIILREGIHSFAVGSPLKLTHKDSNLSFEGYPNEKVWISGGISLQGVKGQPLDDKNGIYVFDLRRLLSRYPKLPKILSLFTTQRRYTRARYPNSDPEIDLWGYASPNRLNYSIDSSLVLEWHRPPPVGIPAFTFVDFRSNPPPGLPSKNDSAQPGYNWYASGHGGACSDVWGEEANSYWCSNASQGGWSEVDQECAITGQMQLPIGMTYNKTSILKRFLNVSGGIIHAWHSQSWAMHMFEIISHSNQDGTMTFLKGGGRQGGRNWCRCDQCTYAAHWCGQHQTPPVQNDTRLIGGTWFVENVMEELDQPGEYYFDEVSQRLYVKPNSTLDLTDFRIALTETILEIGDGATNITIDNIGFRDMAATYMSDQWSAPSGGDWSLHRGGAILIENATGINIRNCVFHRLDGNAIFLSRRTRKVTIEKSEFSWIGENAIATWGDTDDYDGRAENFPMYTLIQHNVMRELGIYQKQSSAVGQCKAALTTIRNNIMYNTPRAAINFNDMLGGGDIIEGNLIFNTCRESGDHGPINSWDRQPFLTTLRDGKSASFDPIPRTIHRNLIFANYGGSQGIDNDDGSSWYNIHHNVFYSADGFKMDYGGHDSIFVYNLVMTYPYDGQQCFNVAGFKEGHGDAFRNNECLIGLGHSRGSGCGDPSCADPRPPNKDLQELVGTILGNCTGPHFILSSNSYYTSTGNAKIRCESEAYSLADIQTKYKLETGSTVDRLPDESTMVQWAKDFLDREGAVTLSALKKKKKKKRHRRNGLATGEDTRHVRVVHVINSCHLDIGFADSSVGIMNRYFDGHIPNVIKLGKEIRGGKFPVGYTDNKLNFMFQSWVINLYLNCPPDMGIHCPTSEQVKDLHEAIKNGDITWHAFPHNAQLEVMGKTMINAGLELTFALDEKFGASYKQTLSQRDVPGLTRSLIPILKSRNVKAISIGANAGSTPPELPPCFLWQDSDGSSLYGLYTWPGYGMMPLSHQRPCILPNLDHALVYNWNGDNGGPLRAEDYANNFAEIQLNFPNAVVVASTFDNFTQHLSKVENQLPIVTADAADSWIYGVPSDPQKVARMLAVERVWDRAAKKTDGGISALLGQDPVLRNATRFALKAAEHTWGKDVKANLKDNESWHNIDFEKARSNASVNSSQYAILEESWWEQRTWAITHVMETLKAASHPLFNELAMEFKNLEPKNPSISAGFISGATAPKVYSCGSFEISFDSTSGAISKLLHRDREWAGAGRDNLWGALRYRSYSKADVSEFFKSYCKSSESWVEHDYGKPGLPVSVEGRIWSTQLEELLILPTHTGKSSSGDGDDTSNDVCTFVTRLRFDDADAHERFGAPEKVYVRTVLDAENGTVDTTVSLFNKTTTRLPESMFFQFNPPADDGHKIDWFVNKLGEWVEYKDEVKGASQHLHGIASDGSVASRMSSVLEDGHDQATMRLSSMDAAVVNLGNLSAYPSPVNVTPDLGHGGASFVLWDNLWGTNYIMWWPFHDPPELYNATTEYFPPNWTSDMLYRFKASFS